jgi:hypothetical protein
VATEIDVTWEADDGYAGGSAPQHLKVSTDDFFEDATIEQVKKQLSEMIQEDFEQTVSWHCKDFEEYAQQIFNALQQEAD